MRVLCPLRRMTGSASKGEALRLSALTSRLPEGRGGLLRWAEETGSTNTALKAWAAHGAPPGTVFLAERQTAGRGRMGRSFLSPPGGLYLSYLLRPGLPPEDVGEITAWVAVAVRRALGRCCGLWPEIKWVNDLLWQGRKLCGILCESVLRGDEVESLVLGIGINVAAGEEDFPPELRRTAASLRTAGAAVPDRAVLAAELIRSLDEMAAEFPTAGEAYWREYRACCVTLGREVTLSDGSTAFAEELERDFSLRLRLPGGETRRLRSGEASLHRE